MYFDPTPTTPIMRVAEARDTPIFDELVEALGHDPLDHSADEELLLATQYYSEARQGLSTLVREAYLERLNDTP